MTMDEPGLFHEEEQVVQAAENFLACGAVAQSSWPSHYQQLLSGYRKLLRHAKRLIDVGDLMQNQLNNLNEQSTRTEEKFRILFHQSRDAIILTSVDGGIIDVNESFSGMFLYQDEDIKRIMFGELLAEPRRFVAWQEDLKGNGYVQDYEWKGRKQDGQVFDCIVTTTVARAANGTVHYQSICRDVTERKKAQEVLVQSEKFRAVVDLTSGVAHNFNNLLQVIMGSASLAQLHLQSGDPEEYRKRLTGD
jgi:PAS domain S-box-containing protein